MNRGKEPKKFSRRVEGEREKERIYDEYMRVALVRWKLNFCNR